MTGITPLEYTRWRETALGAVTERLERAAVLDDVVLAVTVLCFVLDPPRAYYPPVGSAARLLERVDPLLGSATRLGAAFIALAGRKPAA